MIDWSRKPRAWCLAGPGLFAAHGRVVSSGFTEPAHAACLIGSITGTATARAVESSDTMKTVMLRATKDSQKESGFFLDVSVPASSSGPGIIG